MDEKTVAEIKNRYSDDLFSIPGVHSVGVTMIDGTFGIRVRVEPDGALSQIPRSLEGVPVDVVEEEMTCCESVEPVATAQAANTARYRPVQPGISGNHVDSTACTLNFIYEDSNGRRFIGGANHCLARSNAAKSGDAIYQPSPMDGGGASDKIGELAGYVGLRDNVTVDFAWATLEVGYTPDIYHWGEMGDTVPEPSYGMGTGMSGRTSGLLEGNVEEVNSDVRIEYPTTGVIMLRDCFRTDMDTNGGDSGSPVITYQNGEYLPLGVHFAGNDTQGIHCSVRNVQAESGLSVVTSAPESVYEDPTCVRNVV